MELQNGRPPVETNRLEKEIRVYDLLEELAIPFQRVDHEEANTMEACIAVDEALGTTMCKNLFLCNRQKTDFYLLLTPGDKPFKTKFLSSQIGAARLSFAEAEYMEEFLDITPGAVSIMGLMNDTGHRVKLLIDNDVLKAPYIGCHPCVNTSSLKIAMADVLGKFLTRTGHAPTIVDLPWGESNE